MLVYALARSGDVAASKAELERLAALPKPHPLLGALRAFVGRSSSNIDPGSLPDASAKLDAGKPAAAAPVAAGAHAPREPRERPTQYEPREPRERPVAEERPPASGPVDTSDLPGVHAPAPPPGPAPAPAPTTPPPPGVDTSDLPGFK
jgi:hypothetical protein